MTLLPVLVITAIVDSINPCAISVLLLTIGFLLSVGKDRTNVLKIGAAYIFAVYITYICIGLGILQALAFFNMPHFMAKIGAAIIIIVGLVSIIDEFFPDFPIKLKIPQSGHQHIARLLEKASVPAAFALGAVVGLYEFPCTGGPYLTILGLLHDQAEFWRGLAYLMLYNAIFVLPLVVILVIASHAKLIDKVRAWKKAETWNMRVWGGVAMIILGCIIFFL